MTFDVTINGGAPIEIYAGEPAIDAYLEAMIGDGASAYRALAQGSDDRRRLMVAVTRYVDSYAWQGTASASGGTTLQFPRTGLVDSTGATISDAAQLAAVGNTVCELIALAADDSDFLTAIDSGSNVASIGGGGAPEIRFFRPTSTQDGNASVLPPIATRLIGKWLAVASAVTAVAGSASNPGSSCSDFDRDDERKVLWPL